MSASVFNDGTEWVATDNATGETFRQAVLSDTTIPKETGWDTGSLGTTGFALSYGNSPFVSAGEFASLSYADLLAHPSGLGGTFLQWYKETTGGPCLLKETALYDAFKQFTETAYDKNIRWTQKETTECGADPLPFT
jgi:hypothetical protein